jgi:hypothetical protein
MTGVDMAERTVAQPSPDSDYPLTQDQIDVS